MPHERLQEGRLLIVDDQQANIVLMERLLRQAGFANLRSTCDPREVLRLYQEIQPDLVVLDLHMPALDGFAVLAKLRAHTPEGTYLPVLVLTADVSQDTRQRALALGATDFLTKPFDRVETILRIRNLLETRRLHLELHQRNALLEHRVRQRTAKLHDSLKERRLLLARLVSAQEEERRRIARDVHDDSIQAMVATHLRLQALPPRLSDPELKRAVQELDSMVDRSITRLRNLLFELGLPVLDCDGLAAALELYLTEAPGGPRLAYKIDDRMGTQPPAETRTVLYRVAQEALANVRKHARATSVHVLLEHRDDGWYVRIEDDGVGLPPEQRGAAAPGHLGLASMRERAEIAGGWCRVHSPPQGGTTVETLLPATEPTLEP